MPSELEIRNSPSSCFTRWRVPAIPIPRTGLPGGCGENIAMPTPLSLIWMVTRCGVRTMRIVAERAFACRWTLAKASAQLPWRGVRDSRERINQRQARSVDATRSVAVLANGLLTVRMAKAVGGIAFHCATISFRSAFASIAIGLHPQSWTGRRRSARWSFLGMTLD
jgi:hypothetical protein